ncbi:MAG: response regulator [Gaiellales bacterium]|nr:MAG: response regulator [Gaiellales bacterium]
MNDQIRILLVDDELDFAETLAERLRLRSFDVNVVSRAEEALNTIDAGWKPDVVLLDLKMPGMDGMDALIEIRSREPDVETIMLTGHGAASSSIEGMKRGAFDYMMKPVDIGELIEKVEQAVAKKGNGG